jgi:hypothetical protein
MGYLVDLKCIGGAHGTFTMFFYHEKCTSLSDRFISEGPPGNPVFTGFFASEEDALKDAIRVIGSEFSFTVERGEAYDVTTIVPPVGAKEHLDLLTNAHLAADWQP